MRALGLSLLVAHLSLLVGTAQAQLQYCADDLIAYDPVADLSWVTDYSEATGYALYGCLDNDCIGGESGAHLDVAGVDAGGFDDWRVPTLAEYLSIIPKTPDCPDAGGVCNERPWVDFGGKWWTTRNCAAGGLSTPSTSCGAQASFTIVAVGFNLNPPPNPPTERGDSLTADWYSNNQVAAVRTGNACESAPAVPTTGGGLLPLGLVLAALTILGIRQVPASRA